MLSSALFWFVAAVFAAGHLLLIRSAWRLRRSPGDLPAGVPAPTLAPTWHGRC